MLDDIVEEEIDRGCHQEKKGKGKMNEGGDQDKSSRASALLTADSTRTPTLLVDASSEEGEGEKKDVVSVADAGMTTTTTSGGRKHLMGGAYGRILQDFTC